VFNVQLPTLAPVVQRIERDTSMHIRDRIAVMLLAVVAVVAFVTASSGAKYIQLDAIVPPDTMRAGNGDETTAQIAEIGAIEQQRDHRQSGIALRSEGPSVRHSPLEPNSTETIREKKTLALLLLIRRDGRGAR
jgi:hypothetical protein